MNAFEFGFYDELEKIAAQEMYKVRPEVSKSVADEIRKMYNEDPTRIRELARLKMQKPTEVAFLKGHNKNDVQVYDFERPGDSEIIGKLRKGIAETKAAVLPNIIRQRSQALDQFSPGAYKHTHLPGYGRHEPGYRETLPDGSINPWGSKISGPPPRPPMPQPVKR